MVPAPQTCFLPEKQENTENQSACLGFIFDSTKSSAHSYLCWDSHFHHAKETEVQTRIPGLHLQQRDSRPAQHTTEQQYVIPAPKAFWGGSPNPTSLPASSLPLSRVRVSSWAHTTLCCSLYKGWKSAPDPQISQAPIPCSLSLTAALQHPSLSSDWFICDTALPAPALHSAWVQQQQQEEGHGCHCSVHVFHAETVFVGDSIERNNSFLQDTGKENGSLHQHVSKEAFYTAVHPGWKFSLHQDAGQSITAHKHLKRAFPPNPPAAPVKSFYSTFISQVRLQ